MSRFRLQECGFDSHCTRAMILYYRCISSNDVRVMNADTVRLWLVCRCL